MARELVGRKGLRRRSRFSTKPSTLAGIEDDIEQLYGDGED